MLSKYNQNKVSLEHKIFFLVMCMLLKIYIYVLYKCKNQEMRMIEMTNFV